MTKIIVVYDPFNGKSSPEGRIKDDVDNFINRCKRYKQEQPQVLHVGHELYIQYFRLAVINKQIAFNDILFRNHDSEEFISINEKGRLNRWPETFCHYMLDVLREL